MTDIQKLDFEIRRDEIQIQLDAQLHARRKVEIEVKRLNRRILQYDKTKRDLDTRIDETNAELQKILKQQKHD